jgi:hypothetical protein
MRRLVRQLALLALGIALACSASTADEPAQARREKLLTQMRELAEQTKIEIARSDCRPELVNSPVFRYDDQPRRFIDATVWAWTSQGYPVAIQKIEARLNQSTGQPEWGYCFTSLTEDKLRVEWLSGRTFRSSEPGISWDLVPGASAPGGRSADRRRQARDIARGFTGRIVINPKTNRSAEMRLLPTPMFEYDDVESGLLRGAMFGFAVYGTNPDVLVLLEIRSQDGKPQWHFAAARMTTGGITLNYQEKRVWEAEFVHPGTGPYPTWTFFPTPRTPVPGEVTP